MRTVEAQPCQTIDQFAAELVVIAWRENAVVLGRFNQHILVATPGMTREQVMKPWNDYQRRSYQGKI